MAENQDGQEKSEEPTGKRLQDARRKGQVPRSRELNTMAVTMIGLTALIVMGPGFSEQIQAIFVEQFTIKRSEIFDPNAMLGHLTSAIGDALFMLVPLFLTLMVVAILASISLGGFNISAEAMQPKLSKLDPIKGMKKVFSTNGLMELAKSLAKFVLIASTTISLLYVLAADLLHLADLHVERAIADGMQMVAWSSVLISSTLILMALIDVPFQLWQHKKQLKMTKQEVRDESKETEGNPEIKKRVMKTQFEMAKKRMMQEVPKADVIVTNPTHYAVALRYDPDTMGAPVLVAKGKDLIAASIREIAAQHDVPLVEAPLLARSIYFNTEIKQQIPAALFLAVAQLLAYVFQLRAYNDQGGDIPTPPQDYPIPQEYRHD